MQPIVRAEQVEKRFGTIHALAGVSLAIEAGIIYALLGPNGAGKTTLIRVLATLLKPDGGTATVAGIDVVRDPVAVRNRIGLAGQFAAVDEYLTGREAVEMVGRLYNLSARTARERAAEVLERISLAGEADRLVRTYSGGMKRRLDLAASLVGRPDVLFLDEPTTGIDPRSRLEVWALIRDLVGSGTTVLLTTQYLDEADQLAGRIGVIHEGKLITEGTGNQLKDRLGGAVIHIDVPDDAQEATRAALGAEAGSESGAEAGSESGAEVRHGEHHHAAGSRGPGLPGSRGAQTRRRRYHAHRHRPAPPDARRCVPLPDRPHRRARGCRQRRPARPARQAPRPETAMSAAPQPRRRAHVSPRHAIRHTLVIVRRNLLRIVRLPQLLLFATVQPVMFLILFNYVFGGAGGPLDSRGSRGSVPQLAAAGPVAAGRRVRFHPDLDGADRRPQQRRDRPLPLAADGALRGARRTHGGRPDPQRLRDRTDARTGLRAWLPAADLGGADGRRAAGGAGVRVLPVMGDGRHRSDRSRTRRRRSRPSSYRSFRWCSPVRYSYRPLRCPAGCACSPTISR